MEGVEEDDDTHLCLVCQRTITGLMAYVQHKKQGNCQRKNSSSTNLNTAVTNMAPNKGPNQHEKLDEIHVSTNFHEDFDLVPFPPHQGIYSTY